MYIKPISSNNKDKRTIKQEIEGIYQAGPLPEPICKSSCSDYNAAQGCNRHCISAPEMLSSEDETYPLEKLVAPLVFEIKKLGVFHPCWSCEGHNDTEGKLWKIPRVWFYSDSVVHVRALVIAIDQINNIHHLSTRWSIVVTYSDPSNPNTTFSLEPQLSNADLNIELLQSDMKTIYTNIEVEFRKACGILQKNDH